MGTNADSMLLNYANSDSLSPGTTAAMAGMHNDHQFGANGSDGGFALPKQSMGATGDVRTWLPYSKIVGDSGLLCTYWTMLFALPSKPTVNERTTTLSSVNAAITSRTAFTLYATPYPTLKAKRYTSALCDALVTASLALCAQNICHHLMVGWCFHFKDLTGSDPQGSDGLHQNHAN